MFALGNLLQAVASAISFLCDALIILVFVRALLSWVSPDPYNPIVQFIERSTERKPAGLAPRQVTDAVSTLGTTSWRKWRDKSV